MRGGARQGAGRKPGAAGKAAIEREMAIAATGETPLDYMLRVMRDKTVEHDRRDDMARAAAAYVHPKLAQVDSNVKANVDGSITFTWLPPT